MSASGRNSNEAARDLAQWGIALVAIGVVLSFAYLVLPQSTTSTSGFVTLEMDANPGSVVIAVIALLFAGLATIRRAWVSIAGVSTVPEKLEALGSATGTSLPPSPPMPSKP